MYIQHTILGLLHRETLTSSTLKFSLSRSRKSFTFRMHPHTFPSAIDWSLLSDATVMYIKLWLFCFMHKKTEVVKLEIITFRN